MTDLHTIAAYARISVVDELLYNNASIDIKIGIIKDCFRFLKY